MLLLPVDLSPSFHPWFYGFHTDQLYDLFAKGVTRLFRVKLGGEKVGKSSDQCIPIVPKRNRSDESPMSKIPECQAWNVSVPYYAHYTMLAIVLPFLINSFLIINEVVSNNVKSIVNSSVARNNIFTKIFWCIFLTIFYPVATKIKNAWYSYNI